MNRIRRIGMFAAALALLAMFPPAPSWANQPGVVSVDWRLEGRSLSGDCRLSSGQPNVGVEVALLDGDGVVATAETNDQGEFQFNDIAPGVYRLRSRGRALPCRVWPSAAAPPSARARLLLVSGEEVVRGQEPYQPIRRAYTPVWYAVIGAAIVVPVLVVRANQDSPPSS